MVRKLLFPTLILLLISLPFVFNSCQGTLGFGNGFESKACTKVYDIAHLPSLSLKGEGSASVSSVFGSRKVVFSFEKDQSTGQQKAAAHKVQLQRGTKLLAIMDNLCLLGKAANKVESLSQKIRGQTNLSQQLNVQAYAYDLDKNTDSDDLELEAQEDECIKGISYNHEYKPAALTFNDGWLDYQAHLPAINANQGYNEFYDSASGILFSGPPVVFATLDTGVDYAHEDLRDNVWYHSQGVGVDITRMYNAGDLFLYKPIDVSLDGHGTHVAGLIGATSNNQKGVMGTMPYRAQIMPIKVFTKNQDNELIAYTNDVINGIYFAILNGADVVNMSLTKIANSQEDDAAYYAAITLATSHGLFLTAAMGNAVSTNDANLLMDTISLNVIPARYGAEIDGFLAVASIDADTGNRSWFSYYSDVFAEISAPGAKQGNDGVYSTLKTSGVTNYGPLAGTSMAAPQVAAAAGLTIALLRQHGINPTPTEVERLMLLGARKVNALKPYFKDGNTLDLYELVQTIHEEYPETSSQESQLSLSSQGCN